MPSAVAKARDFVAHSKTLRAKVEDDVRQSRRQVADAPRPVERKPGDTGEAGTLAQRRHNRPPKRNKLVYKNRWLISVNIVASLRRAGVACDIIAPGRRPVAHRPPRYRALTRRPPPRSPRTSRDRRARCIEVLWWSRRPVRYASE
jgi:hypothetical protein